MSRYSNKLRTIAELLDKGKYLEVREMTFSSPAGDDMGLDNTCIDFSEDSDEHITDIGDVLSILEKQDKDRAIQGHLEAIERIKSS